MKGLARLLRLLALLVLLALAVLALAVFTEQGARTLLRAVEQLSPVEIDYAGGTLGAGLQLQSLRYAADAVRVELEDVSLDVLPGCLLRGAVCMRDLRVGSLHVRWSGGEWRQGALQADVRLQQSTVEVRSAIIVEPQLVLRETDSADADPGEPSILPAIA